LRCPPCTTRLAFGGVEAGVVRQDLSLQLHKLPAGFKTQLLGESPSSGIESSEGLGLAAPSIQRKHQLSKQPLALRMLTDQCLQLGHELRIAAEREICVDATLERNQPPLLQPLGLSLSKRLEQHVRQRLAAPKGERCTQSLGGRRGVASRKLGTPVLEEPLKSVEI